MNKIRKKSRWDFLLRLEKFLKNKAEFFVNKNPGKSENFFPGFINAFKPILTRF